MKLNEQDILAKETLLRVLVNCQISTYTSLYAPEEAVVPIGNLTELVGGMTRYRARKALKSLIADGLIEYKSQGCPAIVSYGEYTELVDDAHPPINGYALTEKGYESETYKRAYAAWCKSMEEWANGREDDE